MYLRCDFDKMMNFYGVYQKREGASWVVTFVLNTEESDKSVALCYRGTAYHVGS